MRARTQLTVAVTAVVALLVAITGQFLVWRTDQHDRDAVDHALTARAAQIRTDAAKTGALPSDGVYSVRLMSGTQVRARSGATVQFPAPVDDGFSTVAASDGRDYRSWAETLKTGVQLQVLTDYSDVLAHHRQEIRLVDLSVLVAILLGGLAGWSASGIVLRPLRRVEEAARELGPADLSGRLPSVSEPREVAEITASVNALLDRMQATAESLAARRPQPPAASASTPAPATAPAGPAAAPPPAAAVPSPAAPPPGAVAPTQPPALPEPTTSTITPPPAEPDTFPPRPEPEAVPSRPAVPSAEEARGNEELRAALAKLGDDLDTLLDNPELSTTQRHLILASIQNEYRRIVLLTDPE